MGQRRSNSDFFAVGAVSQGVNELKMRVNTKTQRRKGAKKEAQN
jgi:hypothetical protein